MPTKRRRRTRERIAPVSAAMLAYLRTGEFPSGPGWVEVGLATAGPGVQLRADWITAREAILTVWVKARPGSRPWAWWRFDAPRWRREDLPARCRDLGDVLLVELAEPRRRLGGIGTPNYEALNYVPCFDRGIPCSWVSSCDVALYNGRATDIYGHPIGTEYADGDFDGVAIDPNDPPRFESEAAYLDRHGLLLPGERKRLTAAAFEPDRLDRAIDAHR